MPFSWRFQGRNSVSLIGYAGVSTMETRQHLHRQLDALQVAGCECVFPRSRIGHRPRPAEARHLPRPPAHEQRPRLARSGPPRATSRRADLPDRRPRVPRHRPQGAQLADGHHDAGGTGLPADPGSLRRDGTQRHPPARPRGRQGGPRPGPQRRSTADHDRRQARYARQLMADRSRSIPDICRELDDMPSSTLYHYLHADGTLKDPGKRLLEAHADREARAAG